MAAYYNPQELSQISGSSTLAVSRRREMTNLAKEIGQMSNGQLWWDSKIPDNQRTWYRWFACSYSDPKVLQAEVKKHEAAFAKLERALQKARDGDDDADGALEEAYEEMSKIYSSAESQIGNDDSKVLCNLHEKMAGEKDRTLDCLRRSERAHSRMQLRKSRAELKRANENIDRLTNQVAALQVSNSNLEGKLNESLKETQELGKQQKELKQQNELIMSLLKQLVDK